MKIATVSTIYSTAQYEFLFGLWRQGYTMQELAEWIGIGSGTLKRQFINLGFMFEQGDTRPPLSEYKSQFNALRD